MVEERSSGGSGKDEQARVEEGRRAEEGWKGRRKSEGGREEGRRMEGEEDKTEVVRFQ
jgi:hypothetical protein